MDKYLTPKQVAEMLQITERTLANQRCEGRGIPFIKVERAVRYRRSDIEVYLDLRIVKPCPFNEQGVNTEGNYDEF